MGFAGSKTETGPVQFDLWEARGEPGAADLASIVDTVRVTSLF